MTKRQVRGLAAVVPLSRIIGVVGVGLLVANCASETTTKRQASREVGAFPEAKYGKASPRVVSNGERAPKGGGRYLVGKTYTVAGKSYTPREMKGYSALGLASWYGEAFHGRRTANGEVYDMASISAAHPTMPLPSYARVTNLRNNRSMMVRVNDRGPFHGGRVMDVSERVAYYLDFKRSGTAKVKIDYVGPASIAGSDDRMLLATLHTDEAPAIGRQSPVMVASADIATQPLPAFQSDVVSDATEPAPLNRREETAEAFRIASNIPLPPDRPFETGGQGGFPTTATARMAPVQVASVSTPQPRPVVEHTAAPATALGYAERRQASSAPIALPSAFASKTPNAQLAALYYAAPTDVRSHFGAYGDPMARVKTTNLVPFNAVPTPARAQLVVQAGVFRDHANALKLAGALGKSAQVKTLSSNGASVYQVTAGPFASQAQAETVRARAVDAGAKDARLAERS